MAAADHQDAAAAAAAAVSAAGDRPEVGAEAAVSAAGAVAEAAAGELFCFWDTSLLAHAILIEQRSEYLVPDLNSSYLLLHTINMKHTRTEPLPDIFWFS